MCKPAHDYQSAHVAWCARACHVLCSVRGAQYTVCVCVCVYKKEDSSSRCMCAHAKQRMCVHVCHGHDSVREETRHSFSAEHKNDYRICVAKGTKNRLTLALWLVTRQLREASGWVCT